MTRTRKQAAGRIGTVRALVLAVFLLMIPRQTDAQIYCDPILVPIIATGALILANNLAVDSTLGPPGSPFAEYALHVPTRLVMTYLAGDIGIGGALDFGAGAGGGIKLPVLGGMDIIGTILDVAGISKFYGGLGFMDDLMRIRLDRFWLDFQGALASMTRQLYGGSIDAVRIVASVEDVNNLSMNAMLIKEKEIEERKQYSVSSQTCQFDTLSKNYGPARALATASKVAFSQQRSNIANNSVGSVGEKGAKTFFNDRYQLYLNFFCDVNSNAGLAPCSVRNQTPPPDGSPFVRPANAQAPPPQPLANEASSPALAIFAHDTIDVQSDPNIIKGLEMMVDLVTKFVPPDPIPRSALDNASGLEQFELGRQYLTQADVAAALVLDPIGDRMPSGSNAAGLTQNVQDMRNKQGIPNTSPTPSEHEILKTVINMIGDPNYYADMGDNGGTIAQKEVYMKAYNNMLLYKLLEKQEKLAGAYAVQTANMLRKYKDTRNQMAEVPKQE